MRAESLSDEELIRLYRRGNERCFAVLLKRHKDKIYTYITLLVKRPGVVDDLFHDTIVKVIHALKEGKYADDGRFRAWVMRIAHNVTMDYFRKCGKMRIQRATDDYDPLDFIPIEVEDQYEVRAQELVNERMRELVAKLPYDLREVVIMRTHANMPFHEIAWVQQVSINTALGRMRYALVRIREMMERRQIRLVA
jgi:RNA polymerase sigma factor (sigma-70 family)